MHNSLRVVPWYRPRPLRIAGRLLVKYRDFRYVIPFIVSRRSGSVPASWRFAYSLNPMVGVIDGFRWCILGGQSQFYPPGLAASLAVASCFLWFGIRHFRKTEASFADMI
jgi:lipopolysaccharide transport system permease protein